MYIIAKKIWDNNVKIAIIIVFFAIIVYNISSISVYFDKIEVDALINANLANYLTSCNSLFPTKIMKQHWKNQTYTYTTPRSGYGFIFVTHGTIKIVFQGASFTAKAGGVIFLPKGALYSAVFEHETDDVLVNFNSDGLDFPTETPFLFLHSVSPIFQNRLTEIVEHCVGEELTTLKVKSYFYALLDIIITAFSGQNEPKSEIISRAKALLKSKENYSIKQVAKLCNMSESGLRKRFKEEVGVSPTDYRLRYKLGTAKYLLESTDMTVNEIADELAFYDSAYFCRMFKRYIGCSPKEFSMLKQL